MKNKFYELRDILLCPHCVNLPAMDELLAEDFLPKNCDIGHVESFECEKCENLISVELYDEVTISVKRTAK